jgi:amidase
MDGAVMDRRAFLAGGLAFLGGAAVTAPSRASGADTGTLAVPESDLDFASATEVARAIRRGDLSSVEVTARVLDRITRYNAALNAIVTPTPDIALARARAADEAQARGEWWGPLHGVPATIKDTFDTAAVRTTAGASRLGSYVPASEAAVVERLRAAGAVFLGKTNVPEWASDWQTYNSLFGVTRNPWDSSRTPGGSSGGDAAALAAGLTYLSIGSDIDGSIRVPAHFCGVYGHKPSLGIVPLRGHIPPAPSSRPGAPSALAVAGPMARSATDLKMLLEVLGGPDGDEARAYRWSLPPARGSRLADYRIGFVLDHVRCPVAPDVSAVLEHTIEALRKAGAKVEEGWPTGVTPEMHYETYLYLLNSAYGFVARDDQLDELRKVAARHDGSYGWRRAHAWTAPVKHFNAADGRRMAARAAWQHYFRAFDAFVLPAAFIGAFPHDHSRPFDSRRLATASGPREYLDLLFWICFATLAGLPATTAPVGLTADGLPVGVQIIGPYLEDATPIDLAGRLADVVGGFRPPPGYSGSAAANPSSGSVGDDRPPSAPTSGESSQPPAADDRVLPAPTSGDQPLPEPAPEEWEPSD